MYTSVRHWADVLSNTELSMWFQNQLWVIPTSQSIHLLCVSLVFACALMIGLRLLGIGRSGRSASALVIGLAPWIYRALVILLLTGAVQTIAEPLRQFVTPAFWWKMVMVVCALAMTIQLRKSAQVHPDHWDWPTRRPWIAKLTAALYVCLWIGIVFCGRFIAYTWLFHV